MIQFTNVEIQNFCVIERANIPLKSRGPVLIIAKNEDSDGADSNGAGKSTVFKALSWCHFGETVDGGNARSLIRSGEKTGEVVGHFEKDGVTYCTKRTINHRGESQLTLTKEVAGDSHKLTKHSKAETQTLICDLLGSDWQTFRTTVLFGQGEKARFASSSMRDASRKEILGTILSAEIYDDLREVAKSDRTSAKGDIRSAEEKLRVVDQANERAKTERTELIVQQGNVQDDLNAWDNTTKEIQDQLDESQVELEPLRKKTKPATKALRAAENAYNTAVQAHGQAGRFAGERRREMRAASDRGAGLATAGNCPECGQPRPYDEKAHDDAIDAYKKIVAECDELKARVRERKDEESAADVIQARCSKDLAGLKRQIDRLTGRIESHEDSLADRESGRTRLAARSAEIEDRLKANSRSVKKNRRQRQTAWTQLDEAEHQYGLADWWVSGLGPKGVPAYAIEQVLPRINELTNSHLAKLADGDISVCWTAQRPSANGKTLIEELWYTTLIEGVEDVRPSGGQEKKIELATEMALAQIKAEADGSLISTLLMDEPFTGLDAEGRRRVVQWVQGLGFETLLVITHDREAVGEFPTVLTVIKEDGASVVV